MRFAFVIAIDACVARAASISMSASSYAPGLARHDRQRPERPSSPPRGTGDDRPDAGVADERGRAVVLHEPVVGEVVVRADRALLGERRAGHGLVGLRPPILAHSLSSAA